MRFPAGCRQHFFPAGLRERTAREMNWLARENWCIPALLACISTSISVLLQHFLCAHSYCIPALPHAEKDPRGAHYACISIAFLLFPSTFFRAHFYCVPALSACISIALQHSLHAFLLYPSTVFQHCMRAFLLYSSTFLVAFTHVCMCLHVFVCMRLYVLYHIPYTIYHIPYTIYHIPYTVC